MFQKNQIKIKYKFFNFHFKFIKFILQSEYFISNKKLSKHLEKYKENLRFYIFDFKDFKI